MTLQFDNGQEAKRTYRQDLITVRDLSLYLAVSPCTVYRMVEKRAIPHIRLLGGAIRFDLPAIDDWVEARITKPLPELDINKGVPYLASSTKTANHHRFVSGHCEKSYKNFGFGAVYIRYTKGGIARFYLDYNIDHKRIQRVCRKAMNYEDAWVELRQAVSGEPEPKHKSFADFADEYLLILPDPSSKGRRIDTSRLGKLKEHFGKADLRSISPMDLEKFRIGLLKKGRHGSTTNRYIAVLKRMFNLAIDEGYMESNPARKVRLFSELQCVKERILSEEEEQHLLDNLRTPVKEIVIFALNTGMRLNEILSLKGTNVSLESEKITVEFTKSGKARTIPINRRLNLLLSGLGRSSGDYVFTNPISQDRYYSIRRSFLLACMKAGIQGLRFHDLRHTFASRLVRNGVDIGTVRRLLGHSTLLMTQRYVHTDEAALRQAVECLNSEAKRAPENS